MVGILNIKKTLYFTVILIPLHMYMWGSPKLWISRSCLPISQILPSIHSTWFSGLPPSFLQLFNMEINWDLFVFFFISMCSLFRFWATKESPRTTWIGENFFPLDIRGRHGVWKEDCEGFYLNIAHPIALWTQHGLFSHLFFLSVPPVSSASHRNGNTMFFWKA